MKKSRLMIAGSAISFALMGAVPVFAQNTDDTDTTAADDADDAGDLIVVTGSRIAKPNLDSSVPVTSIAAEDLLDQGDTNIGDALNDLPSLRSTYSQANSTRFIGTTGLNLLDLRGLGISRTLVLVNGRRHITALAGDFLVDTNTIPTDLVERVDIVTGGSSAVYGSDAVAGVVNFVLKNDYEGASFKAQSGISDNGDRRISFASFTGGRNFLDGRGNIALNLEYVDADPLYFRDRPYESGVANGRCQINLAEVTTGEPQSGDGAADQMFFCGVRNGSISNGGTVLANVSAANCQSSAFGPLGASAAIGAARCLNPGTPQGQPRIFRFDQNGNLVQDIPTYDFRPFGSGNIISSPSSTVPGATLRETGQYAPGLKRFTANVLGHIDISDAFTPFFEGKYVRIRGVQEGQPSFFSPISSTIGVSNPKCTNAFVTPAMLASLQAIGVCTNPATGTISLNRFNVDFGGRSELIKRDTWRLVGGIRGDFNEDWHYEVSATYGKLDARQTELNDLLLTDINGNLDGFLLAYDSVLVAGVPTCAVNADANPNNNRPDCVPINLFGTGAPSQPALDFSNTTSYVDSSASELDLLAYVSGDSSQLFEFPGGPARFSLGAEYRKETAHLIADPLSAAGGTFFNAFSEFDPPAFKVLEFFGELELPLLKDVPFAQDLTVSGAARYSDYNTPADKTWAYNVGATWAPIRDIRFRANYSQSVRVPTMSDLYSTPSQNFAFIADPCDVLNIGNGSTTRAANCAAAGVPVGFINTPARTASTGYFSSGNPFLEEEKGKSLTIGAVIQPQFIPGLSMTVDYYHITVDNLIAVLGAQTILNQCFDLPDLNNQYCALLSPRNPDSTFQNPALISAGVNYAKQVADGIDWEVSYSKKFANDWRASFNSVITYVIKRDNYVSPTDPTFRDQQLLELGDPQWAANATVSVGHGPFDLRYSLNYIGHMTVGAYENYFAVQGRPAQNADNSSPMFYPATWTHNLRLDMKINDMFKFYMGVDNFMDTKPPLGLLGNEGGNPYDSIGRYFYAGAKITL